MNIRKTILSASILAALSWTAHVQAQETTASADAQEGTAPDAQQTQPGQTPVDLDAVVVQGIRASLQKSLETKRQSNAVIEAITAEDIGKFPDKNVAESLSHVPGVTVDRNFGQGEQVSIRGTDSALNRTLLNDQTIASADWQILDGPGRSFNYTLLSPELVGRLEVYKTPEARIDEGSIGGTVILHTRQPLDLPSNTFHGSIGYAYNDRAGGGDPTGSGLYSWKNPEETFGVLVSALYSKDQLQREGIEVFSYPTVASTDAAGGFPTLTGNDRNATFPNAVNAALFQQDRTRKSVSVGLQIRPSDRFELNFTGLYIEGKYNNYNQSRYAFNNACSSCATDATVRNGVVTDATFDDGGLTLLDAIDREAKIKTYALDLKADWHGDNWDASAQIGTTKAEGGTRQQNFLEFESRGGYTYHIGDASASMDFVRDPGDPATMTNIGFAQLRQQPTHDEEQYLQGDFSLNVDWGMVNQLQFGAKYRDHQTGQRDRNFAVTGLAGLSLEDFFGGTTPGGYLDGVDAGGDLTGWATVDRDALRAFMQSEAVGITYNANPAGSFEVGEKISSVYSQLNFGGGLLRGNLGLRYVRTDQLSVGATTTATGLLTPNRFETSYQDWLPSLNLAMDLNEDVVLRFAASRTISRANFDDLSSFIVLRDTVNTGNGGNPDLEPYRSNNYDLSAEWYFDDSSLLSATAFYKQIGSFIVNQTLPEQQFNFTDGQFETYDITRPRNGQGGDLHGVELGFQHTWASGFGVQTNYTYSGGGTDEGFEVPFNSDHTINLTPFYENNRFSARLTYGWRDQYFREIGRDGVAVTNDAYAQLDAGIGFKFNEHIELTLEGLNLLDETQYRYAGSEDKPLGFYRNGRRYFANVRFKF